MQIQNEQTLTCDHLIYLVNADLLEVSRYKKLIETFSHEYKLIQFSTIGDMEEHLLKDGEEYPAYIFIDATEADDEIIRFMTRIRDERGGLYNEMNIVLISSSAVVRENDRYKAFTIVNRIVKPITQKSLSTILSSQKNNRRLSAQGFPRLMACSGIF